MSSSRSCSPLRSPAHHHLLYLTPRTGGPPAVKDNLYMRGDSRFLHFVLKMRQGWAEGSRGNEALRGHTTAFCGTRPRCPTLYRRNFQSCQWLLSQEDEERRQRLSHGGQLLNGHPRMKAKCVWFQSLALNHACELP